MLVENAGGEARIRAPAGRGLYVFKATLRIRCSGIGVLEGANEALIRFAILAAECIVSRCNFCLGGQMISSFNRLLMALGLVVFAVGACATPPTPVDTRNSALTQGNVQMNLRVGTTTKAEVLETFGSPNVTTRDGSGREVWSYQRAATVSQSSSTENYWTIILAGASNTASGFQQSSRMITLIIKFDENDVVSDFRSRESNF